MNLTKPLSVCIILLIAALACDIPSLEGKAEATLPVPATLVAQDQTPGVQAATATPNHFSSAIFYSFPDNATFIGEASISSLWDFCLPPQTNGSGYLTIGEFGALNGQCSADDKRDSILRNGALQGAYDADNHKVVFHLETVKVFSPGAGSVTSTLVFNGQSTVKDNTASGDGEFTFSCTTEGEGVHCIDERTSQQLSGTMPFLIEFLP